MRTHIAKALQKWSKTIQRAIKMYNAAASALDPPRPTIDWNTVSHYKFLEDFPLLRNTSQDLTGKRWALPAVWETMKQWRRICCAWKRPSAVTSKSGASILRSSTKGEVLTRSLPNLQSLGQSMVPLGTLSHKELTLTTDCSTRSLKFMISKASLEQCLPVSDK